MWTIKLFPLSQYIEAHIRDQIKSLLWLNLHNGLITSSQFETICHHRSTTDNTNIIRQLMGYQKMARQMCTHIQSDQHLTNIIIITVLVNVYMQTLTGALIWSVFSW